MSEQKLLERRAYFWLLITGMAKDMALYKSHLDFMRDASLVADRILPAPPSQTGET